MTELINEPKEISECKERVKTAEALFSWECVPPRNFKFDVFLVVFSLGMSCFWGVMTDWHTVATSMMFLVTCSVTLFLGVTAFQPHYFKYTFTLEGVRVIDEERIPDFVFTIIRSVACLGVIICLIAVAVVGPIAFVGAAAAALAAFKFTGFKKEANHYVYLFYPHSEIRYFEKEHALGIFPIMDEDPNNIRSRLISDLHVNPAELDDLVNQIKQVIDVSEVKFVECSTELVI
ncbi:hypothetical protein [Vibrio sp. WXL210]|uniref:hypothetical protein n=1 Tax=Vibrio sp. WXL210 TaxID=3450709 RepID=UPI003EC4C182